MSDDALERVERLSIDIDTRLTDLWATAWEKDTPLAELLDNVKGLSEALGLLMRAAYGQGYCDAIREVRNGRMGEMAKTHGYALPS